MRGRTWTGAMLATLMAFALALAPLIISATHGPGAALATAEAMAETAVHGHSHDDDGPRIGHDVTDHDHQHSAILPTTRLAHDIPDRAAAGPTTIGAESVATRGPLRPPRA